MSTPEETFNKTQQNLIQAKVLMQTEGRVRGASYVEGKGYCPLGAVTAVRTGLRGESIFGFKKPGEELYDPRPEISAFAKAVNECYPSWVEVAPLGEIFYFDGTDPVSITHYFNDTVDDDEKVFAVIDRAIELAGEADS